jgi:hypothetical protein
MNVSPRNLPAPVTPAARWGRAFLLVATLGVVLLAPVPICPTRNWLHVPCPGCGATRAVLLALRGDFAGSFHLHPLAMVVAAMMIPTGAIALRGMVRDGVPSALPRPLRYAWYVVVAALFVVWLARFAGYFGGPAPI